MSQNLRTDLSVLGMHPPTAGRVLWIDAENGQGALSCIWSWDVKCVLSL